ncbi:hypothetical protein [Flagellimonas lutaonensis]|uniref:TonB C-terminal domain-containing protein n=1 Tax=Flagellimonas lutaonensis TaxID=516051 RepID=A0A0D5YU17_9FLAO|nr:hypothetical protein [Allomuricauda lutaonensis]AKA35353.1 hypothetical protein VC82_1743 [Allomuricauda lutaonensis]
MRTLLLMVGFILFVSCELFTSRQKHTDRLINEELMAIDWNDVDQYPLFEECDELAEKPLQLQCFREHMIRHMADTLEGLEYQVSEDLQDTVRVDLLIDEHGFITVLRVQGTDTVDQMIPGFNDEITERLNDLTTVKPAIKRGVPVSIKFRLPIVLNTEN